ARALDGLGGLTEQQVRRLGQERTSDREHPLLAAREHAPRTPEQRRESREQLERLVERGGAARAEKGHPQILLDREAGKDLAPLRDVADPRAGPAVGRPARDLS